MRELVAVNHFFTAFNLSILKRQALMFDRISVPHLSQILSFFEALIGQKAMEFSELEWLCEQGVVIETKHEHLSNTDNEEYLHVEDAALLHGSEMERIVKEHGLEEFDEFQKENIPESVAKLKESLSHKVPVLEKLATSESFIKNMVLAYDYYARGISIELRELKGYDAYPILMLPPPTKLDEPGRISDIVSIALNALPVPDENTPWEQIIEFRQDPDSRDKYIDLKDWMSEVAKAKLTPREAEDKLEHLLSRYRRHMELHKMKVRAGTIETCVVTTGDLFEHLAHLEFGKLARALFSFRHRQIELKEGELNAPGNGVAYVFKARETFS